MNSAIKDFMDMIRKSWTYNKMTQEEKEKWDDIVYWNMEQGIIKGSYKQRNQIMNGLYHAYLAGLGYTDGNWRN